MQLITCAIAIINTWKGGGSFRPGITTSIIIWRWRLALMGPRRTGPPHVLARLRTSTTQADLAFHGFDEATGERRQWTSDLADTVSGDECVKGDLSATLWRAGGA